MKRQKSTLSKNPLKPWSEQEAVDTVAVIIEAVGREPKNVEILCASSGERSRRAKKISGRDHIRQQLQAAAAMYHLEARWNDKPTPSELIPKLSSVENAASRIFHSLGIDTSDGASLDAIEPQELRNVLQSQAALMAERLGGFIDNPPFEFSIGGEQFKDWRPDHQLSKVLEGLAQIQEWAKAAKAGQQNRLSTRLDRHAGNVSERKLIGDLVGIWIDCYHERPKLSRTAAGKPSGPFFRFVVASFDAIGAPYKSGEALYQSIRTVTRGRKRRVKSE